MSIYYGDLLIAGTGGIGTWDNPFKLGDLSTSATMDTLVSDDELRIKGKPDADIYTDLAGTLTLDEDNTYISTSVNQTGIVTADDIVYLSDATGLKFYPIYSVSATQLSVNNTYFPGYCLEDLVDTSGKVIKLFNNLTANTYFIRYIDGGTLNNPITISFGWTASDTQDGKTFIFNKTGAYTMYWFYNSANVSVNLNNLFILSIRDVNIGGTATNCILSGRMGALIAYKGTSSLYNYMKDTLNIDQMFKCPTFYYNAGNFSPGEGEYNLDVNCLAFANTPDYSLQNVSSSYTGISSFRIGKLFQTSTSNSNDFNLYFVGGVSRIENIRKRDAYIGIYSRPYDGIAICELGNITKMSGITTHRIRITTERSILTVNRIGGSSTDSNLYVIFMLKGGVLLNTDFAETISLPYTDWVNVGGSIPKIINCKINWNYGAGFSYLSNIRWLDATNPPNRYSVYGVIQGCKNANGTSIPDIEILSHCDGTTSSVLCGMAVRDTGIYRTISPSLKFCWFGLQSGNYYWFKKLIYVKGEANKTTTVTAYMRKSATYGSSNLPYIKLYWYDVNGNLQSNISTMTDVNNTWVQLQVSGTPVTIRDLELEVGVYGYQSGAYAWLDDLTVEVA